MLSSVIVALFAVASGTVLNDHKIYYKHCKGEVCGPSYFTGEWEMSSAGTSLQNCQNLKYDVKIVDQGTGLMLEETCDTMFADEFLTHRLALPFKQTPFTPFMKGYWTKDGTIVAAAVQHKLLISKEPVRRLWMRALTEDEQRKITKQYNQLRWQLSIFYFNTIRFFGNYQFLLGSINYPKHMANTWWSE